MLWFVVQLLIVVLVKNVFCCTVADCSAVESVVFCCTVADCSAVESVVFCCTVADCSAGGKRGLSCSH